MLTDFKFTVLEAFALNCGQLSLNRVNIMVKAALDSQLLVYIRHRIAISYLFYW